MSSILAFDGIVREYVRGVPVLNGVTFSLDQGEIVGLLGRNGSGKTTLLHIAMGMLFPQAGSVRVFGMSPSEQAVAVKKRVGFVAEDQALPTGSSIGELIAFHKYLFPKWDEDLEKQILERFSLSKKSRIMLLSKGQARAAALLLAVCHRPELLLLDEPAAGLDPAARRDFLEVAIQFLNRAGATVLYSSHYMNDIERIGSRIVMLDGGKIRLDTSVDELREDYCLALVSQQSVPDVDILRQIPGCVGARLNRGDWHAVFKGGPEDVKHRIEHSLGSNGIVCDRMSLEDLFVELMGEKRAAKSSS
jgi:ABC-2 type transport system ATP-binding protein